MKILLLMPCDEQHVYMAAAIYKALDHETKDVTFAIPVFMDYLINGKIVGNWVHALFYSMLSCKKLCEASDRTNENLLIIGNAPSDFEFDAVFNFQDLELALPYEDKFMNKAKELVAEDEKLFNMLNNVYKSEDSKMSLRNSIATADFLSAYMKTDPQLKKIKDKYEKDIKDFDLISKRIEKAQEEYSNGNK